MVTEVPVKRKYGQNDKAKTYTRIFKLNGEKVCRELFIRTLHISTRRIHSALTKVRNLVIKDKRGIKGGHNKTQKSMGMVSSVLLLKYRSMRHTINTKRQVNTISQQI